jgi:hypothetical protein
MTLITHYPLTEDAGSTARDYSGNGNDGTANGAGPSGTGTVGGPIEQTAYDFDGSSDTVTIGDISLLEASNLGNFTVSAFVKPDATGSTDVIIGKDNEYKLTNNSGTWQWSVYDSGNGVWRDVNGDSLSSGQWYRVTGTWDGATQRLYVNGIEQANQQPTVTLNSTANTLAIGDNSAAGNNFDGAIADIRIYDRALSPSEVSYLYQVSQSASYVSDTKTL